MLTQASLTAGQWQKVRPGLRRSLRIAARNSQTLLCELINRLLGPKRGHIFFEHQNGERYWLLEEDIPTGWTAAHWTDLVVQVVRSPMVRQAGTFEEWPFGMPRIPYEGTRIHSPSRFLAIAHSQLSPTGQPIGGVPGHHQPVGGEDGLPFRVLVVVGTAGVVLLVAALTGKRRKV